MSYYTYIHRAGYGRDDHRAPEIIARAALHLGLDGAEHAVLQSIGFASHACPLHVGEVRLPYAAGMRHKMVRALRLAFREARQPDCRVDVQYRRERLVEGVDGNCYYASPTILIEKRQSRGWVVAESYEAKNGGVK